MTIWSDKGWNKEIFYVLFSPQNMLAMSGMSWENMAGDKSAALWLRGTLRGAKAIMLLNYLQRRNANANLYRGLVPLSLLLWGFSCTSVWWLDLRCLGPAALPGKGHCHGTGPASWALWESWGSTTKAVETQFFWAKTQNHFILNKIILEFKVITYLVFS